MRQAVGRRGHTLLQRRLHHGCNIKQDAACIPLQAWAAAHCMTHPKYLLRLIPAPEITRCTPHGAPQATNQTKLLHFYISYALFQPGGKKERCIFKAGALKIDVWPSAEVLFSPQKHPNTASVAKETLQLQRPTQESVVMFTSVSPSNTPPPSQSSDSSLQWLMGYLLAAGVLWETSDRKVMGIPASWAQSEALKKLKPQQTRPAGLIQSWW